MSSPRPKYLAFYLLLVIVGLSFATPLLHANRRRGSVDVPNTSTGFGGGGGGGAGGSGGPFSCSPFENYSGSIMVLTGTDLEGNTISVTLQGIDLQGYDADDSGDCNPDSSESETGVTLSESDTNSQYFVQSLLIKGGYQSVGFIQPASDGTTGVDCTSGTPQSDPVLFPYGDMRAALWTIGKDLATTQSSNLQGDNPSYQCYVYGYNPSLGMYDISSSITLLTDSDQVPQDPSDYQVVLVNSATNEVFTLGSYPPAVASVVDSSVVNNGSMATATYVDSGTYLLDESVFSAAPNQSNAGNAPTPSCLTANQDLPFRVAWFQIQARANGNIGVDTLGSSIPTFLAVYNSAGVELPSYCSDEEGDPLLSPYISAAAIPNFPVQAGQSYYVMAGQIAPQPSGDGEQIGTNPILHLAVTATGSTLDPGMEVTTGTATVSSQTATLSGTVNPNGVDTKYTFIYAPCCTLAGAMSTQSVDIGSETVASPATAYLTGLTAATTYLYQLQASNGEQTVSGEFGAFTTPPSLQFVPVTPCRVVDTRLAKGPFGGPGFGTNNQRNFIVPQGPCPIPSTAAAYSLNVTVVPNGKLGFLQLWPSGQPRPTAATLTSDGRVKSIAAIVPAGANGGLSAFTTDPTHVILDIDGYFVPAGTAASALAFYPIPPCRVVDTRNSDSVLGGPYILAGTYRDFPIEDSSCDLPPSGYPYSAQAYSLNITAIPSGPLGYLTTWPTGQPMPVASTLTSRNGEITANAVIVPAGSDGEVSIFVVNTSNVVIDVNGYFAAPGPYGLSLYPTGPCRVLDTREGSGAFIGTLTIPVESSPCAISGTAQAYVLNTTVVPDGDLGSLTLWPRGNPCRPLRS